MKKLFLLMLFVLVSTFSAMAQVDLSLNIRAGYPTYTGSDFDSDMKIAFGAAFALGIEYPITDLFSVQGDIGYSIEKISYDTGLSSVMNDWHEIELRTFAKIKASEGGIKPYAKLGPTFSYVVVAQSEVSSNKQDVDLDSNFILGAAVELGIEVKNVADQLFEIGILYQRDLTKYMNNLDVYKHTIGVSLSYLF